MSNGSIISSGDTGSVFREPGNIIAARLTGCKNISDAKIIDDHTVEAIDWGVILKLKREIPAGISKIGYRAHRFTPVWGREQENWEASCSTTAIRQRSNLSRKVAV